MEIWMRPDGLRIFLVFVALDPFTKKERLVLEREDGVLFSGYTDTTFVKCLDALIKIGDL